jgi:hypothetical protein
MAKGTIRKFLAVVVVGGLIVAGCSESDAEKQAKLEKEVATQQALAKIKAEEKQKGFHCLSGWDGSHTSVVRWVKNNLKDPDSYQHKETRITPMMKDGKHVLVMEYRAKNSFGGYVINSVMATVDNDSCQATIL